MDDSRKQQPGRPKSRRSLAHISSRSNSTTDIAVLKRSGDAEVKSKKTRGKSIGPGGLEALTETDANALKLPPPFQPRSILKPSVPLTPPKAIPSFNELRQKSNTKPKSPARHAPEELLIDFSTPGPNRENGIEIQTLGAALLVGPFSPVSRPNMQQSPGRNRQSNGAEKQPRPLEDKSTSEYRAARRKSLANRRVSFAPEATLHTWSVMEMMEDSTTSSAANSTRRQSSMTAVPSPAVISTATKPDDLQFQLSDIQQIADAVDALPNAQGEQLRKRRRTSDVDSVSDEDDVFSSPGDAADSSPIRLDESADSESDTDGDTAMSLDEATHTSIRSSASSNTQNSLDERLRQAASQAGTRGIGYDEDGTDDDDDDRSMEFADDTITHAFKHHARASTPHLPGNSDQDRSSLSVLDSVTLQIQENEEDDTSIGMTMDMTRAVGSILPSASSKSITFHHETSSSQLQNADLPSSDDSMDLTVAKGGILSTIGRQDDDESDEEITMEMTTAMGGVRDSDADNTQAFVMEETESMDMTVAAGGILAPIEEQTEPQSFISDSVTVAMDMTKMVGGILQFGSAAAPYPDLPVLLETEPQSDPLAAATPTPFLVHTSLKETPASVATNGQMAPAASETGSPSLKPRLSARRNGTYTHTTTPKTVPRNLIIKDKHNMTPTKQLTPAPIRGTSPQRTPVLTANVTTRTASPRKLFIKELEQRSSPASRKSPRKQKDALFAQDENTGMHTPRVILHAPKPHQHLKKRGSGVGLDKCMVASPRLSEVLSRRSSLTQSVLPFQLTQIATHSVDGQDPLQMQQEIDAERAEEHRRESGRFIMEQEANEQQDDNTTQNLRDMIESMTPKKSMPSTKLKGRKSLAAGSAKGLLGKRPAELDEELEEEESTPKRLKTVSREGSPIKNIRLPKGPRVEETTGRLSRAVRAQLSGGPHQIGTPTASQSMPRQISSPDRTGKFKTPISSQKPVSFEARLDNVVDASDVSTTHPETVQNAAEEKVSLQQFLNMTNVHFIELSTTKRRHTVAQLKEVPEAASESYSSETAFVAAASTLPQLDLYKHATRELNTYVSSGRKDIRQIEAEMLVEQPPIFREYMDAQPDVRAIMDDQFRCVKARARLQSKEGWYVWRGQLVEGLHSGLEGIKTDLEQDDHVLSNQENVLNEPLIILRDRKVHLEQQVIDLKQHLEELSGIDRAELRASRTRLLQMDKQVARASYKALELQQQIQAKTEVLSQAAELRQEMSDQIDEARRVQAEQSRWHKKKVGSLKAALHKLEEDSGWRLLSVHKDTDGPDEHEVTLILQYKDELQLNFNPSSLRGEDYHISSETSWRSKSNLEPGASIRLDHAKLEDEDEDASRSVEGDFFLQALQSHLRHLATEGLVNSQTLLSIIVDGWSLAQKVSSEIKLLSRIGIVQVLRLAEDKLCIVLMLMQADRSRVDVGFQLTISPSGSSGLTSNTSVTATPIYGNVKAAMEASQMKKVQNALSKEVASRPLGDGSWLNAVSGFEQWLSTQMQAKAEKKQRKVVVHEQAVKASEDEVAAGESERKRAATASPQRSTTPKMPARSPLAPRTTNSRIQKKMLPVPKKPSYASHVQHESQMPIASQQKENMIFAVSKGVDQAVGGSNEKMVHDDVFRVSQAAITPEMQEAMMHTPVKKRPGGALRRSPY